MEDTTVTVETVEVPEFAKDEKELFEEYKKNKSHFQQVSQKYVNETQKEREDRLRLEGELKAFREQPKTQVKVETEEKPPVEPQEPTMPRDYYEIEAHTDPNSASAKYDKAYKAYLKDMAKFAKDLATYNNKKHEKELSEFKSFQEEQKKASRLTEAQHKAIAQFKSEGLADEEARKAFEFFSSEESLKPKNLVKMWKALTGVPEKEPFTPPAPPSGGGKGKPEGTFLKGKDTSWIYKTK